MNTIKILVLCIIVIIAIISLINLMGFYNLSFHQKPSISSEAFQVPSIINPISIMDTATSIMTPPPFDTTSTPTDGAILRYDKDTAKWVPYTYAKMSYTVNSKLKLTSTAVSLLTATTYTAEPTPKIYYAPNPNNTISTNPPAITANSSCRYKVTVNITTYIYKFNVPTNIILELYHTVIDTDKKNVFGYSSTYFYDETIERHISLSVVGFTEKITSIIPTIRLEHTDTKKSVTYYPKSAANLDATVNITVEEY